MDRRGFIQRVLAASGAFMAAKAGASVVESKPPKTTTPCVAVTADTSRFETELERTERILREHIKKCCVVRYDREASLDGPPKIRAVYATSQTKGPWDAEVARLTKNGRVLSVNVKAINDEVDVWMLGSKPEKFRLDEPKYEIDVTWLVS